MLICYGPVRSALQCKNNDNIRIYYVHKNNWLDGSFWKDCEKMKSNIIALSASKFIFYRIVFPRVYFGGPSLSLLSYLSSLVHFFFFFFWNIIDLHRRRKDLCGRICFSSFSNFVSRKRSVLTSIVIYRLPIKKQR